MLFAIGMSTFDKSKEDTGTPDSYATSSSVFVLHWTQFSWRELDAVSIIPMKVASQLLHELISGISPSIVIAEELNLKLSEKVLRL